MNKENEYNDVDNSSSESIDEMDKAKPSSEDESNESNESNVNDEADKNLDDLDENEREDVDVTQVIAEKNKQLLEKMEELSELFKKRILFDDQKEKFIDNMHDELDTLRKDLYSKLTRPILMDIINLRNNMFSMLIQLKNKHPDGMISVNVLDDYLYDLANILEDYQVEIYELSDGEKYIPKKQKIVKQVTTDDENLHGIVAESKSSGYMLSDKIISPQKVSVYHYKKEKTEEQENE